MTKFYADPNPVGVTPPIDHDRQPILKLVGGDSLIIETIALQEDGTAATPGNSKLLFTLADQRFSSDPIWQGYWYDGIVEVGGAGTFTQSVKAVAIGGQVSIVGALAGLEGSVEFMSMFMSQARYQPIAVGSRQDLEDLVRFITEHQIRPVIDSRYPLEQLPAAFAHQQSGQHFGKIVVHC